MDVICYHFYANNDKLVDQNNERTINKSDEKLSNESASNSALFDKYISKIKELKFDYENYMNKAI